MSRYRGNFLSRDYHYHFQSDLPTLFVRCSCPSNIRSNRCGLTSLVPRPLPSHPDGKGPGYEATRLPSIELWNRSTIQANPTHPFAKPTWSIARSGVYLLPLSWGAPARVAHHGCPNSHWRNSGRVTWLCLPHLML